jgi:hypothetical protein
MALDPESDMARFLTVFEKKLEALSTPDLDTATRVALMLVCAALRASWQELER